MDSNNVNNNVNNNTGPVNVNTNNTTNYNIPDDAIKGYDKGSSSKVYPIICTICGIVFIIAVYVYIYMTRNKSFSSGGRSRKRNISNKNHSNSAGSNNRIDIHIDKSSQSKSSFNKSSFNMSSATLTNTPIVDRTINNNSPYSDTNNLLEVNNNNINFLNAKGIIDQHVENKKKYHYPNPLFAPSKPVLRTKPLHEKTATDSTVTPIIRSNDTDLEEEVVIPQNLNILTQEEAQLLKMRTNNLPIYPREDDENLINYNSMKRNHQLNENQLNDNNPFSPNRPNDGKFKGHRRSMSTPDLTAVAPFNFVDEKKPNEPEGLFNNSQTDNSYYNNNESEAKIETKKIEYIDAEDVAPINKIKIKRFNN